MDRRAERCRARCAAAGWVFLAALALFGLLAAPVGAQPTKPPVGAQPTKPPADGPAKPPADGPAKPPADGPAKPSAPAADAPAAAGDTKPDPAQLAEAKRLFREGNELRRIKDFQKAYERYIASRNIVASLPNTMNAAVCLDELGRFDEALELYQEVLTRFKDKLKPAQSTEVKRLLRELGQKLGAIDVRANVDGELVIDGRPRGKLPLHGPVRVLPGKHKVQVMKDGYKTFMEEVEVTIQKTLLVEPQLEPLAVAGRMRIDEPGLEGADVYIDGAPVGAKVPWKGTLEPGTHHWFVRKGDQGTAPGEIVIVKGQTVLAEGALKPLGPEMRIVTEPVTAEILIGDVMVGAGKWHGRLPVGPAKVEVREEGYFPAVRDIDVGPDTAGDTKISLAVDEDHPRWGVTEVGSFWFDVFGGLMLSSDLDSSAEATCDEGHCKDESLGTGFMVGAHLGYEFPVKISVELAGGYMSIGKEVRRRLYTAYQADVGTAADLHHIANYTLTDEIRIHGPFVALGASHRLPFAEVMELRSRALVGVVFTESTDQITGSASDQHSTASAYVEGPGESLSAVDVFLMPEVRLGLRFDGFDVGLGLAVGFFLLEGPEYGYGNLGPDPSSCEAGVQIACAPASAALQEEHAYGTYVVWLPSLSAGYLF